MAISFPTGLDNLTNPKNDDKLNNPDHAGQHSDANDILEALQVKVGVDNSAVESSHDYKIAQLETNKLTDPLTTRGDIIIRGEEATIRLAKGSNGQVLKMGANEPDWANETDTTYDKATGSELDTGTNDTKYATAKALDDSKYFKSDETVTLTNKTIDADDNTISNIESLIVNSQSTADASSITPTGNYKENEHYVTALEQALTINAPSGTASNGNTLMIRIKDDGTTRSLTWNSAYTWIGTTEPEDTTASKVLYVGAIYNSTSEKWEVLSVVEED
jgi:hypothetical protein